MLRLRAFRSAFAPLVVLAAIGCGGAGQSGSELLPPPSIAPMAPPNPHCPCDSFRQWQPIRAAVVSVQPFGVQSRYELLATEVLAPDPLGRSEVVASSRFGGYWDGRLGCEGISRAALAPGDEVLAFYRRGTQDTTACCELFACEAVCYREIGQDASNSARLDGCRMDCVASTQAECGQHRVEAGMRGELMLLPWAEALVVGASDEAVVSIARDQLASLQKERAQCTAEISDLRMALHPSLFGQGAGAPTPAADPDAGTRDGGEAVTPPAPSNPPSGATPSDAGAHAGSAAPPGPPCCKPLPPSADAGSGAQPSNTPGTNPTSSADPPPPSGPEDPRVRCANP